jgi:hypothetical protein
VPSGIGLWSGVLKEFDEEPERRSAAKTRSSRRGLGRGAGQYSIAVSARAVRYRCQPFGQCRVLKRSIVLHVYRIGLVSLGLTLGLGFSAVSADVVAVVSSKSPITTLSKNQLLDVFFGKRTSFPDGSPAVPIDQIEGSAARDEFYSRIAGMSPAQVKAFWAKIIFTGRGQPPRTVATSLEAKKLLIANPNSISYIDQNQVDSGVRVVLVP